MLRLRSPRAKASSAVPSIVAGPITEADVTHTYDWSDFQQERDKEELTDYPHFVIFAAGRCFSGFANRPDLPRGFRKFKLNSRYLGCIFH